MSGVRGDLGWLDSPDLFNLQTLTLLHKVRRTGEPESLAAQFLTNRERPDHVRSTRQDDMLSLPRIRGSASGKRMFAYRAALQYNALPPEFADMSVNRFKHTLKRRITDANAVHR